MEKTKPDSCAVFRKYLAGLGLKRTPQREEILRAVLELSKHFEAEEVLLRLRRGKSRIARASVYRTLKLLGEAGIIRPVIFTDRHQHFEQIIGKREHAHLICLSCGRVIEFSQPEIIRALERSFRRHDFQKMDYQLEAVGYCRACRSKKGKNAGNHS